KNTFASLASLATFALKNPRVEQSERLPFLNKRTHFKNHQNHANSFINMNYEQRTTNWCSQKRTQTKPISSLKHESFLPQI
ncbi:MAG: hypothetical protein ACYSU8_10455, partial [Planctomycetota bacterium]